MTMNSQTTIGNVISAIKKHHIHEWSEFWREERKKNRDMLSPFFWWEKDSDEYRARLVTRWCHYREEIIATYIIDVLLETKSDSKYTDLQKFHEVNQVIIWQWKTMAILKEQKKIMHDMFSIIHSLEAIEKWVKRFIHKKHKDLRSPWFQQFWYQINEYTEQKTIDTKPFRNRMESTIGLLPTKTLQQANDDLITLFIKQQVKQITQWKSECAEVLYRDNFNWFLSLDKWIIAVIHIQPQNTHNIIIATEWWSYCLLSKFNSKQFPGLYRNIKTIENLFVLQDWLSSFYCGHVITQWSEKEYLFDGTNIIERFNQQEIQQFSIHLDGKAILAKFQNPNGEETQHMFLREKNAYERMQITHFIDPESKKTLYIESIIEADVSWWKVYAHVMVKWWPSKKVYVISFADLKTSPVSTD